MASFLKINFLFQIKFTKNNKSMIIEAVDVNF